MAGKIPSMDVPVKQDDRSVAHFFDAPTAWPLARSSVFSPGFETLLQRLDRLHDHVFAPPAIGSTVGFADFGEVHIPKLDVTAHDKHYLVEVDVPGYDKQDLSIDFVGDRVLRIIGKHSSESSSTSASASSAGNKSASDGDKPSSGETTSAEKPRGEVVTKERHTMSFSRDVPIDGAAIDRAQVSASLKNGVLAITLPKTEAVATSKKIEIA